MCCQDSKPIFKGVLISTTIIMVILQLSSGSVVPYCVYLEQSQELDCVCPPQEASEDSMLTFPPENLLLTNNQSVASLKLHSCGQLRLQLDLRPLQRPFYRLRLEDIEKVEVDTVSMLPGDIVDVWFRNINHSVVFSGAISCTECEGNMLPELTLNFLAVRNVTLRDIYDGDLSPRLKVRSVETLSLKDCYFGSLNTKAAIEVVDVANVSISHSEFHNSTAGAILLDRVTHFSVRDSLLERSAVEVMDNKTTSVVWQCTISPLVSPEEALGAEELKACAGERMGLSEGTGSAGAIALAVISAMLLLAAVAVLVFLHRSGKLEQYL